MSFDTAKISKPKLLNLRIHHYSPSDINNYNCKPLDTVRTIKYLGVYLDDSRVGSLINIFISLRHKYTLSTIPVCHFLL